MRFVLQQIFIQILRSVFQQEHFPFHRSIQFSAQIVVLYETAVWIDSKQVFHLIQGDFPGQSFVDGLINGIRTFFFHSKNITGKIKLCTDFSIHIGCAADVVFTDKPIFYKIGFVVSKYVFL